MQLRAVVVVLGLVGIGCKGGGGGGRAAQCDRLVRQAGRVADGVGLALGGDSSRARDREMQTELADLRARCLAWPDEVFACMRPGADPESPRCQAALSVVTGVTPAGVADAPDGPPVVATATLGAAGYASGYQVALDDTGGLIVVEGGAISSWDGAGQLRWRTELAHRGWTRSLPTGELLVGLRGAAVALDRATGLERWRAPMPPMPAAAAAAAAAGDDDVVDDVDDADVDDRVEAAVVIGPRVLLGLGDARFVWIDPVACGADASGPACVAPAFALPGEVLEEPVLVEAPGGAGVVLGEGDRIRLLTLTGATLAAIQVRDTFGGLAVTGRNVAVTLDDELVVVDLSACAGAAPVALPRKRNRMYLRGEGDCDACVRPPRGCLVARTDLDGVDAAPPNILRDGSIVVTTDDGLAQVAADGRRRWVSDVAAFGSVGEAADELIALVTTSADGADEDADATAPLRVVGIDRATGKARWGRTLEARAGDVVSIDDATVAATGAWVVARYKASVAWLRRP